MKVINFLEFRLLLSRVAPYYSLTSFEVFDQPTTDNHFYGFKIKSSLIIVSNSKHY